MIFLIEYDRTAGRARRVAEFQDTQRRQAQNERLQLELSSSDKPNFEFVLLDAKDIDQLKQTHRRYFDGGLETITLDTFLKRATATLDGFASGTKAHHIEDAKDFPLRRSEEDWWNEVLAYIGVRDLHDRLQDVVHRAKKRDRSGMS